MWDACAMPFVPELFSAPALARLEEKWQRDELVAVPYFDGLMAGEPDALVESFAAEPELHDPVRGRVKGARAFKAFVNEMTAWIARRNVSVEDVEHVVTERRGFEEVVLHLDAQTGRVALPVAIVADRQADGRIDELRIYSSSWPLSGRHANRPPLLQPDPELRESDDVAEYQRALAAGALDAIVAAFEPHGYAREPAGGQYVHRGPDGLRSFYQRLFSNDGGIPLEHCALTDDKRACALEYNVVRWGHTELPPAAGVAVYVRGQSGRLAAVRIYDDAEPPLAPRD
jgi:SnoaL-like domain